MKYKTFDTSCIQSSGCQAYCGDRFISWQPSTWPEAPVNFDDNFYRVIKKIFESTIIDEIDNVISDAKIVNGSIEHRGHVVVTAQLCAIDALASYAFFDESSEECAVCKRIDSKIRKYNKFIEEFFPDEYKQYNKELYTLYRNAVVHSWNLFEASIMPDSSAVTIKNGILCFGLLNFQDALTSSLAQFLEKLKTDTKLQNNTLERYRKLKGTARK